MKNAEEFYHTSLNPTIQLTPKKLSTPVVHKAEKFKWLTNAKINISSNKFRPDPIFEQYLIELIMRHACSPYLVLYKAVRYSSLKL